MKINYPSLFALLLLSGTSLHGDVPEMWLSVPIKQIPNATPAKNSSFSIAILVTIFNPSSRPITLDVYDMLAMRVSGKERVAIEDDFFANDALPPTYSDVIQLGSHLAFSRVYDLYLEGGVLKIQDGAGGVHRFPLPRTGEYTIELAYKSDANNPMVSEFEAKYGLLAKEFYRGPHKFGAFKIQISDLNQKRPEK